MKQSRPSVAPNVELAYPAHSATPPGRSSSSPNSVLPPAPVDFGTLTITSDKPTAEIFVDHQPYGNSPLTLQLPVGRHEVLVTAPGRLDILRIVQVPRFSNLTINADFDPPPQH